MNILFEEIHHFLYLFWHRGENYIINSRLKWQLEV